MEQTAGKHWMVINFVFSGRSHRIKGNTNFLCFICFLFLSLSFLFTRLLQLDQSSYRKNKSPTQPFNQLHPINLSMNHPTNRPASQSDQSISLRRMERKRESEASYEHILSVDKRSAGVVYRSRQHERQSPEHTCGIGGGEGRTNGSKFPGWNCHGCRQARAVSQEAAGQLRAALVRPQIHESPAPTTSTCINLADRCRGEKNCWKTVNRGWKWAKGENNLKSTEDWHAQSPFV